MVLDAPCGFLAIFFAASRNCKITFKIRRNRDWFERFAVKVAIAGRCKS